MICNNFSFIMYLSSSNKSIKGMFNVWLRMQELLKQKLMYKLKQSHWIILKHKIKRCWSRVSLLIQMSLDYSLLFFNKDKIILHMQVSLLFKYHPLHIKFLEKLKSRMVAAKIYTVVSFNKMRAIMHPKFSKIAILFKTDKTISNQPFIIKIKFLITLVTKNLQEILMSMSRVTLQIMLTMQYLLLQVNFVRILKEVIQDELFVLNQRSLSFTEVSHNKFNWFQMLYQKNKKSIQET